MAILRRLPILALAGLSLILSASSPANAKALSVEGVTIRGPGLEKPLSLEAKDWGIPRNENSPTALISEGLLGGHGKEPSRPGGSLGAGYELHYRLAVLDIRTNGVRYQTVTQWLHPFAERGPVAFTPSGQSWTSPTGEVLKIEPGWQEFPPVQVRRLQRFGFPSAVPAPPSGAPSQAVLPWSQRLLWPALAVGVTALVLARFRVRTTRGRRVGLP